MLLLQHQQMVVETNVEYNRYSKWTSQDLRMAELNIVDLLLTFEIERTMKCACYNFFRAC